MKQQSQIQQARADPLEEYKLCVTRQDATESRIWPMSSVLLVFGLGGLAIFGRESVTEWQTLAVLALAGGISSSVLWAWRLIDKREAFREDIVWERMWKLERDLGFLTNLSIRLVDMPESTLQGDEYWKDLTEGDKKFISELRQRHRPSTRIRNVFDWMAVAGTVAWIGLFAVRAAELATTH